MIRKKTDREGELETACATNTRFRASFSIETLNRIQSGIAGRFRYQPTRRRYSGTRGSIGLAAALPAGVRVMAEEKALTLEKGRSFRFTRRPMAIAAELRPDWKMAALLLILQLSSAAAKVRCAGFTY